MWFVVIESISIFSSLLINTYYAGAIKSRNEIEVEGMLLNQGIVACATLVVAICLCPIVEEIIYRVIIQKMLDEKTKTVSSMVDISMLNWYFVWYNTCRIKCCNDSIFYSGYRYRNRI